jgi:hypothetical protein
MSKSDDTRLIDAMQQVNVDAPEVLLEANGQPQDPINKHASSLTSTPNVPFAMSAEFPHTKKQLLDADPPVSVVLADVNEGKQATAACGRFRSRLPSANMCLGCIAFWLCGVIFGMVAIVLEFTSRRLQQSGTVNDQIKAQRLRKVSRVISVVGIIVGTVIIVSVTCAMLIPRHSYYSSYCLPYDYEFGPEHISTSSCFMKASTEYSCSTCLIIGGVYSNNLCYYDYFSCPGIQVDSQCFEAYEQAKNGQCRPGEHFSSGYCYYYYYDSPWSKSCKGYMRNCQCYANRSTTFTELTCNNIKGFYARDEASPYTANGMDRSVTPVSDIACYYNAFKCNGYAVNGQCYSQVTWTHTATTCKNIDGFFVNNTGQCYSNGIDVCPFTMRVGNECYKTFRSSITCSSCKNSGGRYLEVPTFNDGRYDTMMNSYVSAETQYRCYFPETVDLSGKCNYIHLSPEDSGFACETNRSSDMNIEECRDVDGTYDSALGYCYYTPCAPNYYSYRCNCYKSCSSSLDSKMCNALSGVYDFQRSLCFRNPTFGSGRSGAVV